MLRECSKWDSEGLGVTGDSQLTRLPFSTRAWGYEAAQTLYSRNTWASLEVLRGTR